MMPDRLTDGAAWVVLIGAAATALWKGIKNLWNLVQTINDMYELMQTLKPGHDDNEPTLFDRVVALEQHRSVERTQFRRDDPPPAGDIAGTAV